MAKTSWSGVGATPRPIDDAVRPSEPEMTSRRDALEAVSDRHC